MNQTAEKKQAFPRSFWAANSIELFERAAYYAVASFVVIYLNEDLLMNPTFSTFLNGTILWGMLYFLPILSGTLADKFGFRRSLMVSFVMISIGYFIMGFVQEFWPALIGAPPGVPVDYTIPVLIGILFIGIGGSIVKPCIAGTVQKTAGTRSRLGFAIFYMVINIGSISGRAVSYFIRTQFGIPAIFTYVATIFALLGLFIVIFIYREPKYSEDPQKEGEEIKKKTMGQAILGIFKVLANLKFLFFIIFTGLFWFVYLQIYNLVPLFLRSIDPTAPVELYTMANPFMIVALQLLISRMVKKWTPIRSIIMGSGVLTLGMLINIVPILLFTDFAQKVTFLGLGLPIAGIFMIGAIASMAIGEMMASPRIFEYIGAIAPRGEEGLYLGYANLPIALGSFLSPIGGALFSFFILNPQRGRPSDIILMWLIVSAFGVISMIGMAAYDKFIVKTKE
jgi:POT family proton-dependent oligopeptide transporter